MSVGALMLFLSVSTSHHVLVDWGSLIVFLLASFALYLVGSLILPALPRWLCSVHPYQFFSHLSLINQRTGLVKCAISAADVLRNTTRPFSRAAVTLPSSSRSC